MGRHFGALLCAAVVCAAAACATPDTQLPDTDTAATEQAAEDQRRYVLGSRLDTQRRVRNVAYRVLTANADLCGEEVAPALGLYSMQLDGVPREYRQTAVGLWSLGARPRIMHVVPGSAAARAGLAPGDILLAVNGRRVGEGRDAAKRYVEAINEAKPHTSMHMVVERGGKQLSFNLMPSAICDYPVLVNHDNSANAFTDGKRIVVNDGILKIARSDEELALVIGHELAHITRGHIDKKTRNAVLAGAGGLAIDVAFAVFGVNTQGAFTDLSINAGAQAFSQGFEKEADYVGIYHMARAGYDTKGVERFWRQMAAEDPASITFAGTHPTSTERYALIAKTHEEVAAKRAANQPLMPNIKSAAKRRNATRRQPEETR